MLFDELIVRSGEVGSINGWTRLDFLCKKYGLSQMGFGSEDEKYFPEYFFVATVGINPGDSGMPVVAIRNGKYELVGLAQAYVTDKQKLGLVLKINVILRVIKNQYPDKYFPEHK